MVGKQKLYHRLKRMMYEYHFNRMKIFADLSRGIHDTDFNLVYKNQAETGEKQWRITAGWES
jgi:hypothetical protein